MVSAHDTVSAAFWRERANHWIRRAAHHDTVGRPEARELCLQAAARAEMRASELGLTGRVYEKGDGL